ncbi:MAG: photosystem II stability/assembly factor-like protein [Alphaproteobacteria bacterium HGW-Alphaproteobacteria-11]|nr:MAG: photosystem II stability/assembly factor-like protein [Alphaproteobacteria bacterium HGW-Alphaproteobacteria-11]
MLKRKFFAVLAFVLAPGIVAAAAGADPSVRHQGTSHDALFDIAFDGARGIAVGNRGVVLESDDGGKTWTHGPRPNTELALLGVATNGDRRFAVGQSGQIFRATSRAWTAIESGTDERLFAVAVGSKGTVVVVGAFGTILVSQNDGESWSPVTLDWMAILGDFLEPHFYAAHIDGDTVTIGGEFGLVLRSRDRGTTWTVVHKGEASIFDFSFNGRGKGLALGQNGLVVRTDDGGASWRGTAPLGETNLLGVWFNGERALTVGIRGAFASRDGGRSWTAVTTGDVDIAWYQAVASPAGRDAPLAVGHSGRILEIRE